MPGNRPIPSHVVMPHGSGSRSSRSSRCFSFGWVSIYTIFALRRLLSLLSEQETISDHNTLEMAGRVLLLMTIAISSQVGPGLRQYSASAS